MKEFNLLKKFNWEAANQPIAKTEYYTLDLADTNVVEVGTTKGIVEIFNINGVGEPRPAFDSSVQFYINNSKLLLTDANKDNIYIQYSVYYKSSGVDNAIPYVISNGMIANGLGFQLYNANPAIAGVDNWEGAFYLYYEMYNK